MISSNNNNLTPPLPTLPVDGNGSATRHALQSEVHEVLVEAVEVAAARGMPLAIGALAPRGARGEARHGGALETAPPNGGPSSPALANGSRPTMPHGSPWEQVPAPMLEAVRQVDIMASL